MPIDLPHCWENLDTPGAVARLAAAGVRLWKALFDEATTGQLLALIDRSPGGTPIDVVVSLAEPLAWLPVELLRLPEDLSVRSPRGEGTVLLVQMPLSAERVAEASGQPRNTKGQPGTRPMSAG